MQWVWAGVRYVQQFVELPLLSNNLQELQSPSTEPTFLISLFSLLVSLALMRLLQQMTAINNKKKTALAINNKRGLKKKMSVYFKWPKPAEEATVMWQLWLRSSLRLTLCYRAASLVLILKPNYCINVFALRHAEVPYFWKRSKCSDK